MSEFNEELYQEMIQNEENEAPRYDDEVNCYSCVFTDIVSSYE